MVSLLLESNIITYHELYRALTGNDDGTDGNRDSLLDAEIPLFQPGDIVRVRPYENCSRSNNRIIEWKRPHIRTPGYIYGVKGRVVDVCGRFGDPSILAFFNMYSRTRKGPTNNFHHDGGSDDDENTDENRDTLAVPSVWLYRVEVSMSDLWPEQSTSNDVVSVEVYEHWLERTTWSSPGHSFQDVQLLNHDNHGQDSHGQNSDCTTDHHLHDHHHHHHDHHHDGDHSHDPRIQVERRAVDQEGQSLRPGKELFYALLQIIVDDKKLVSRDELRTMVEALEKSAASLTGATLVVKAWTDPGFRQRLLDDPVTAAREVGIVTSNPNAPTVLTVVESTPEEHQLVVCTLCSCYPSGLLGISPSWYRDRIYRARAVREPRKVLEEFGTILPPKTKIRVHDSTADHRYLVLPQRPDNTDGWSEEDLRKLVSRDSMIGVTIPTTEML
jgi:nitrile hydratase